MIHANDIYIINIIHKYYFSHYYFYKYFVAMNSGLTSTKNADNHLLTVIHEHMFLQKARLWGRNCL